MISSFKSSLVPAAYSFMQALLTINFALEANCRVLKVSWKDVEEGLTFAIIKVLEFPPKESFRRKVSLLFR